MQIIYYTAFILSEFLPLYYFIVKKLFRLLWLPKPAQALVAQHKTFVFIHNHWHWGGPFPAHLWSTTSLQSQVSKRIMFHHMPWSATKTTSSYMHRSGQRVSYRLYPSSSQRMCIDQHIFSTLSSVHIPLLMKIPPLALQNGALGTDLPAIRAKSFIITG